MPTYAEPSKKMYQNEKNVYFNHNDLKTAFIPFQNKEINVCLATAVTSLAGGNSDWRRKMPNKRKIWMYKLGGFGMHGEGEIQRGEGIWIGKSYKFNGCCGEGIWMGKSYKFNGCCMLIGA